MCHVNVLSFSRWGQARIFHDQLSQLAESEDNISHLRRLAARIEEGMEAEVTLALLEGMH